MQAVVVTLGAAVVVSSICCYVELLVYDKAPVAIIIVLRHHGYCGLDRLSCLPQMAFLKFSPR